MIYAKAEYLVQDYAAANGRGELDLADKCIALEIEEYLTDLKVDVGLWECDDPDLLETISFLETYMSNAAHGQMSLSIVESNMFDGTAWVDDTDGRYKSRTIGADCSYTASIIIEASEVDLCDKWIARGETGQPYYKVELRTNTGWIQSEVFDDYASFKAYFDKVAA